MTKSGANVKRGSDFFGKNPPSVAGAGLLPDWGFVFSRKTAIPGLTANGMRDILRILYRSDSGPQYILKA